MKWPWTKAAPPVEHDECEVCRSTYFLLEGSIIKSSAPQGQPVGTPVGIRLRCERCYTEYRRTSKGLERIRPIRVPKDEEGPAAVERNGHEPEGLDTDLAAPRSELKLRGMLER